MKIPKLQAAISSLFPNAQILSSIPPDEVISIGCANQATYVIGTGWDEDGENLDVEITTLPTDVYVNCVNADKQPIDGSEKELFIKKGSAVPSIHGLTIAKSMKKPVQLAIHQGDHVDYIESEADKDLVEISARLHGGVQQHNDLSKTIEPATIHIHLN